MAYTYSISRHWPFGILRVKAVTRLQNRLYGIPFEAMEIGWKRKWLETKESTRCGLNFGNFGRGPHLQNGEKLENEAWRVGKSIIMYCSKFPKYS